MTIKNDSENILPFRHEEELCSPEKAETETIVDATTRAFPMRLLRGGDIDGSLFDDHGMLIGADELLPSWTTTPGYLPIEADETLRKRIKANLTIDLFIWKRSMTSSG
jgi:hypothetical protein